MAKEAKPKVLVTDREGKEEAPVVVPMQPAFQILIRGARTFIQVFLGTLGFTAITPAIVADDLTAKVIIALEVAAVSAAISILQNTAELLAKLDQSNPAVRA